MKFYTASSLCHNYVVTCDKSLLKEMRLSERLERIRLLAETKQSSDHEVYNS